MNKKPQQERHLTLEEYRALVLPVSLSSVTLKDCGMLPTDGIL